MTAARRIFRDAVVAPAWAAMPGGDRLVALLDAWRTYQREEVFTGGCFLTATSVEYGHRDGPVAESVRRLKREWLDLLAADLAVAGHPEPQDAAFRIDALLAGASTMRQLFGDDEELDRGHRLAAEGGCRESTPPSQALMSIVTLGVCRNGPAQSMRPTLSFSCAGTPRVRNAGGAPSSRHHDNAHLDACGQTGRRAR